MKTCTRYLASVAFCFAVIVPPAQATLNIPSDGSDGALVISGNTTIDLSQAASGNWDTDNSANAGKGIYDSNKWAVVFKYSSVLVNSNCTVTFKNHASRAPVVWLVQSNATINGTVSLDGQGNQNPPYLAEPGPGGFRSGAGYYASGADRSDGFGIGGGLTVASSYYAGFGGSFGSQSATFNSSIYGNPSLLPLIGGSGGAGGGWNGSGGYLGGGAGGGAILVACGSTMTVSGTIRAAGGSVAKGNSFDGGSGSGGAIRVVAETLAGAGSLYALTGDGYHQGGYGRIRIERGTNTTGLNLSVNPASSVVELSAGATPLIWVPTNGPSVRVVSIGGNPAPTDPRSGFGAIGADVALPRVSSTTVVVETTNVEQTSQVTVRATPRANGNYTSATASVTQVVSQDPLVVRWTANVSVQDGYSAMQVQVVRP